jgi:hypothetical protein
MNSTFKGGRTMSIELMKAVRTFISAEAVKFHESDYNEMTEDEKAKFAEANQEVSKICSQLKNSLTKEQWQLIMDLKSAETFKNIIIHDHMISSTSKKFWMRAITHWKIIGNSMISK